VILCSYVDDILIFGTNNNVIKEVKDFLSQNFEMKDLGEPDVILNIKLVREGNGGVHTWRWRYFLEVLQAYHLNKVNNGSKTHGIRHCHC
jgi:hypothetical protein